MHNEPPISPWRALVVDDEPLIRKLIVASLTKERFLCDSTDHCDDVWNRIRDGEVQYDLVVTDLAMPGLNGHAFAVNLLTLPERPMIVVLTGVLEPRLAKDLLARGIDDIVFKPIHFASFAAKMRSLVDRRRQSDSLEKAPYRSPPLIAAVVPILPEKPAKAESMLSEPLRTPLPAQVAVNACELASRPDCDLQQLCAAVECHPILLNAVLRLAGSCYFNASGSKLNLEQSVARLGRKTVSELALAALASPATTQARSTDIAPLNATAG